MTTPTEGVNESVSLDDATELFLNRWADADDRPSDADKGETSHRKREDSEDDATVLSGDEDTNESDEDEDLDLEDDDDSDDTDQDEEPIGDEATDDHKVRLTVDGEERTVTVKELKRLYGQEASLTRKSQEVAEARKRSEQEGERFIAVSQKLLAKAEERFKPFEGIDWMVAQQRLTPDEFAALRKEAVDAATDVQYLQSETNEILKEVRAQRQAEFVEQAQKAIEVLERDVPGWNQEVYNQVLTYATNEGMDPGVVAQITDPAALKMFHKAMRLDALKAKAATKKAKPKADAPKRVVKPGSSNAEQIGQNRKSKDGFSQLAKTGRRDDAVAAFLERWADDSDG